MADSLQDSARPRLPGARAQRGNDAGLYERVGGHDERFRGWGAEDREFFDRLNHSVEVGRLPGRLLHLDHARAPMNHAYDRANRDLLRTVTARGARAAPDLGPRAPSRKLRLCCQTANRTDRQRSRLGDPQR